MTLKWKSENHSRTKGNRHTLVQVFGDWEEDNEYSKVHPAKWTYQQANRISMHNSKTTPYNTGLLLWSSSPSHQITNWTMNSTASTKAMPGNFFSKISTTLSKRLPKIWRTAQFDFGWKYTHMFQSDQKKIFQTLLRSSYWETPKITGKSWIQGDFQYHNSVFLEYFSKWSWLFWRCWKICDIILPNLAAF